MGYSFLIGIGFETVFLFLLDIVGIKFSAGVLSGLNIFSIVAINGLNYKNLLACQQEFKMPVFDWKKINPAAIAIFCAAAYLFYVITVKNLFWPSTEHDSIGSFDKLGRVIAIEGQLKISLFQYHLEGAGGVYPPLYHGSLAYGYLFGSIMPKFMTTLYFLSALAVFYAMVRKYVDATAAMLFTLLFMLTPELFAHAALGLGNLPTTAYVAAGALTTLVWLDKRETKYYWLGAITMAFVLWIRSDTIVFTAAVLLLVGIDFLRNKNFKQVLVYGIIIVAPFILWTLYLKLKVHEAQSARFSTALGGNGEKMILMKEYVKAYLFGGQFKRNDGGQLYGVVFPLFFLMFSVNLVILLIQYFSKSKEVLVKFMNTQGYALLLFFVSFGLYFAVFYMIDEKAQNATIDSLMDSSFKRGMFCFVPIALFYCATGTAFSWLFGKIEKFRTAQ